MIAIIDYGAGNLQSVKKALDFIGAESLVTSKASEIENASACILPGVGSFGDAMNCMTESGLCEAVKKAALGSKPFLGICLGLQLLFDSSEESPGVLGLGILKGKVKRFCGFRISQDLRFRTSGGIPQTSKSLAPYMTALQTARLSILFIPIISTPKIARTSLRKRNTEFRSILPWLSPK